MALQRLAEELKVQFVDSDTGKLKKTTASNMFNWVNNYIEEEQKNYKQSKSEGKILFGKHRGSTPEAVANLEGGIGYLEWCLKQHWFSEDRWGDLRKKFQEVIASKAAPDTADEKKE